MWPIRHISASRKHSPLVWRYAAALKHPITWGEPCGVDPLYDSYQSLRTRIIIWRTCGRQRAASLTCHHCFLASAFFTTFFSRNFRILFSSRKAFVPPETIDSLFEYLAVSVPKDDLIEMACFSSVFSFHSISLSSFFFLLSSFFLLLSSFFFLLSPIFFLPSSFFPFSFFFYPVSSTTKPRQPQNHDHTTTQPLTKLKKLKNKKMRKRKNPKKKTTKTKNKT